MGSQRFYSTEALDAMISPAQLSKKLSIIIPTRNESQTILMLLDRLRLVLPEAEVLVIDGGNDNTAQMLEPLLIVWSSLAYHTHTGDRGKGHAIRTGIQRASRPYIAQIDADLQFFPEDLTAMAMVLEKGEADFVCGSRFLTTSSRQKESVPGLRGLGNRLFSLYTTLWTQHRFTDVLAGIKVWRREVTETFTQISDDFCYEVELPVKALKKGFHVVDYPVSTAKRHYGQSSVPTYHTALKLLRRIPQFASQGSKVP